MKRLKRKKPLQRLRHLITNRINNLYVLSHKNTRSYCFALKYSVGGEIFIPKVSSWFVSCIFSAFIINPNSFIFNSDENATGISFFDDPLPLEWSTLLGCNT